MEQDHNLTEEKKKTSNNTAEPRESENRQNLDKQQADAAAAAAAKKKKKKKKEEEDLKLRQSSSDMPELKDDHGLQEDETISLDLSEPPPEVMEYARREVGETDEVKCQTLQEFRDMIYEKGECLPHRMEDDFLLRFLRARNFNLRAAHRLIVNYYNFKENHPEIHQNMSMKEMKYIGDDDVITVPIYRTQCRRRMLIYRMGNWDPRKYPVEDVFKATVILLELGVLEPIAQIMGGIVIFDLKDITMAHAWAVTPQVASMMLALMVTSFPIKTHAIHILHQSWIFDAIFVVFKPLLDTNMRNRIHFHGNNYESLHKYISPEYLPKRYGGTRDEIPYYKWIESLVKDTKIVEEMSKVGYVDTNEVLECFNIVK
ncbi:alpha-tocopherol transfer protein isoform X3 [Harpegnathos saltator]|uniref:alpha-tocopherol transfer protein isoform X3 n=1 Tax=Harpegnathos saltator TaxID=610380 RepID=UPI000DBEE434|nr:alpha-tocopherol transfer protein isoform X3 [Harpegnathos saltator]